MSAEDLTRAVLTQDGRVLIEQPDGSYLPSEPRTDWARVRALSDEELEAAAASDPDALPLDEAFWREARVVRPLAVRKKQTALRIDEDVLAWFRAQGRGYQARMNAVLRAYVGARRRESKIGRSSAPFGFVRSSGRSGVPTPRVRSAVRPARVRLDSRRQRLRPQSSPRNLAPAAELASARAERPFAAHDPPKIRRKQKRQLTRL